MKSTLLFIAAALSVGQDAKQAKLHVGAKLENAVGIPVVFSNDGKSLLFFRSTVEGNAVDSEKFRSDDVTFDGPPLFYWDAESRGVFYHKSPEAPTDPYVHF